MCKKLDFTVIKFPVHKIDLSKIEKQNSIPMNVFAYEDETPYCIYTSEKTFEKHIDLLLLSNFKNSHCFN